MKKMHLFIILFCISCTGKPKIINLYQNVDADKIMSNTLEMQIISDSSSTIRVKDMRGDILMNISSVLDSITYICLSNEPEALIGGINKILFTDDEIYILDRYKTRSLKKYSSEGQFICNIGCSGPAPEEYVEPTDFDIIGEEIKVYDQFKSRINTYKKDGSLVNSQFIPFLFSRFHFFSHNEVLYYALNAENTHLTSLLDYNFFKSDSLFRITSRGKYRKYNQYISLIFDNTISVANKKVYYHYPFSDTVYSISSGNRIKTEYTFDFGSKHLPHSLLYNENRKKMTQESNNDKYLFLNDVYVLDDYLYFVYAKEHLAHHCFYSMKTKKTMISNALIPDLYPYLSIGKIIGCQGNTLIGYDFPYSILEQGGRNKTPLDSSLAIDDNPILILSHLKTNN